jgi:AraC family transcriptional regulator
MAPCHFHRIFREFTGEPVHRYVRRVRLEYAAYRILLGDAPIIEVALDAGYESHSAFTRAFKQEFRCPPAELRTEDAGASIGAPQAITRCKTRPDKVALVRHFGPYTGIRSAWSELSAALVARNLEPSGMQAVGIVHDGPECGLEGSIRYDACAVVPNDFEPDADVGVCMLPSLDAIAASHRGLPDLLVCCYIRLVVDWLTSAGRPSVRPIPYYERYRSFPFLDGRDEVHADVLVSVA